MKFDMFDMSGGLIILCIVGKYSVGRDYMDANVNDTFDVITDPDGHYKSYKIIKDDKNGINQIKKIRRDNTSGYIFKW